MTVTVDQLITKLQKFPKNMEILIWNDFDENYYYLMFPNDNSVHTREEVEDYSNPFYDDKPGNTEYLILKAK